MNLEAIDKKIKGVKTFKEVQEILSDEEIIYYVLHDTSDTARLNEDDKRLVIDILQLFSVKRRSTRRSLFVLEKVKDMLLELSCMAL